jgi:hypothetical protein
VVSACPQFIKVAARDVLFRTGQRLKDTFWLYLGCTCVAPRGGFEVHEWITRQPTLSAAQRPYPGAPYGKRDHLDRIADLRGVRIS